MFLKNVCSLLPPVLSLALIGTASYLTVKVLLLHKKDPHTPPLTWVLFGPPAPNVNTVVSVFIRYWWFQKGPRTPPPP